jgi:hypothetical protein
VDQVALPLDPEQTILTDEQHLRPKQVIEVAGVVAAAIQLVAVDLPLAEKKFQ